MIIALFILGYILYSLGDGYSDGVQKRLGTERHWTKWPPRVGVFLMVFCAWHLGDVLRAFDYWVILALVISFKPMFDIGWSVGRFGEWIIYIGEGDITDILLHKLGLVKLEKKFPIITALYFFGTLGGLILMYYSTL